MSGNPISKAIDDPTTYAIGPAGRVVASTPEQVAASPRGSLTPVSGEVAQGLANANSNQKYVDQNWGSLGEAAVGAADGATLGLGPALATKLGLLDQGHLEAAQQSGAYTAGEVGGFLIPALASGGEGVIAKALSRTPVGLLGEAGGLAERAMGRLLPEAGLLGKTGEKAIRMAARGGTEAALMNVAHQTSHDIITNTPLSAQALLATGLDGLLFGGVGGLLLGGAAGLAGSASESLANRGMEAANKGERSGGFALKRVGLDPAEYAASANGTVGAVRDIKDLLEKGGASFASPTNRIREVAQNAVEELNTTAKAALKELGQVGAPTQLNVQSILSDLNREYKVMYYGTTASREAAAIYRGISEDIGGVATKFTEKAPVAPKAPKLTRAGEAADAKLFGADGRPVWSKSSSEYEGAVKAHGESMKAYEARKAAAGVPTGGVDMTWESWGKSRELLAEKASKLGDGFKKDIYESALQRFDAEFRAAGEAVSPEIFGKYAAATAQKGVAESLVEGTEKRLGHEAAKGNPLHLNQTDGGALGIATLLGNPLSGAGIVASRKLVGYAQDKLEPLIAEYAARSAIGAKAGAATANVGERISGALRAFIRGSGRAVGEAHARAATESTAPKLSYTMKAYHEAMATADRLTSEAHQQKVREHMDELTTAGHPELAQAMGMAYGRAVADVTKNRPKGTLGDKSPGSLGKTPKQMGLDTGTMKFLRRLHAMRDPVNTIVDGLEKGNLSRDAIASIKYVMPDLHQDLVMRAAHESMAARAEGKFLPADKLALLGVALDHPVDSKLSADFINEVQQGLAANAKPQPKGGGGGGGGSAPVTDTSSYQTPLQSAV